MKNLAKQGKNFVVKNVKAHEVIIFLLLIVYIFSGVSTPTMVAPYVNNMFSYFFAFIITVIVLIYVNPVIGILFGIAFYILFNRTPNYSNLDSSEKSKSKNMSELNSFDSMNLNFPKNDRGEIIQIKDQSENLEVEIIDKMVPVNKLPLLGDGSYHPIKAGGVNYSEL